MSRPVTKIFDVFAIAIVDALAAAFPAAPGGAAGETADRVQEMVAWIRFPVRRFPAARNDHAGTQSSGLSGYGGREMHGKGDGTNDSIGVIHEAYKLPEGCLTHQIKDAG